MPGVNNPGRRQGGGLLDTVMKGLQIASQVYGIKAADAQLENMEAQKASAAADKERSASGKLTKGDQIDIGAKGYVPAKPGETPDFTGTDAETGGVLAYVARKKDAAKTPLQRVTTKNAAGKWVNKWVDPNDEVEYEAPPPARTGPVIVKSDGFTTKDLGKAAQEAGDNLQRATAPYKSAMSAADSAKDLLELAKTNPVATAPALRKLARASGEQGVLTDADVEAFGGSQAIFARLARASEQAESGTLPEADARFAAEIAAKMKATASAGYEAVVTDSVSRFSANFGGTPEENYKRLTGQDFKKKEDVAAAAPPPKASAYKPGSTVMYKGKPHRVEADGDTLTEISQGGSSAASLGR